MGYSWSGPPITAHGHVSRHGNNRFGLNAFGVSVSMSPEGNFVAVGDKWSESGGHATPRHATKWIRVRFPAFRK